MADDLTPDPLTPADLPISKAAARFTEVGHEGLYISAGYVQDEFLPALAGGKAIKVYREMGDNDPIVGAMLFAIKMLVRAVEWTVEPHEDGSDEDAEFVEGCFHDMTSSWEDTLSQIITFVQYGWAYHEIVYKRRQGWKADSEVTSKFTDNKIGWKRLPGRAQETLFRWEVEEKSGRIMGMHQRVPHLAEAMYIPSSKALHFRTQSDKGNPEGRSMLRNAYRPWWFKTRIEQIEATGIERDLAGFPVMWVPHTMLSATATVEEKQALEMFKEIVRSMKRDEQEGLVMPLAYDERGNKMFDLTLMASSGKRQFDTDATVARYSQQIAMTVLADFIMLGHEAVGSKALGATKIDLFTAGLEAWLDSICDVFNTHAIPKLLQVNGMDPTKAPKLAHQKIQSVDPAILGTAIAQLAQAGMPLFPDDNLENHVREAMGMPPRGPESPTEALPVAPEGGEPGQKPVDNAPNRVDQGADGKPVGKKPEAKDAEAEAEKKPAKPPSSDTK